MARLGLGEARPAAPATARGAAGDGRRLPSLTGMRFIAAFIVFAFHVIYEAPFSNASFAGKYARVFGQGGWTGVAFFFVLSGFVLTWSARPGDPARRFWRRRVAKIVPDYLLTYLAAIGLLLASGLALGGWRWLPGLFMVESWFPQPDIETSANPVAWSLSCEAFFYLCFPLLLWLIVKIRPERLWFWAIGVAGLVWCVPLIGKVILPGTPVAPWAPSVSTYQFWFVYVFPPTRMLEFVLGMLMARIVATGKWIRFPLPLAWALAVFAYAIAPDGPYIYQVVAITVVPIALLIPAAAAADLSGKWSPTKSRLMVWLGTISYAFYLWHRLILIYGHRLLGPGRTWDSAAVIGLAVLAFAVVILVAWLTYRFVEVPLHRRIAGRTARAAERSPAQPELNAA
jgi:peptidoglycan/LPS O-acetylase OafA/YrhL